MLDDDEVRLKFLVSSGEWVDMSSGGVGHGELSGWYNGEDGWLERFARQRVNPVAEPDEALPPAADE